MLVPLRNESSRYQRAVETNLAACPRPLWVKVVWLADGEDVADWIPRVVGDRVEDEAREAVDGELQALVEAAVVIDLNSIVDAPSESEVPRPVADALVVEAPIPAGTQHGPDDSSGSEGRRYSLGRLRSSFPAASLRKPDRPMRRSVKDSMQLARHHDADLTFGRYAHTRLEDLSKVVDRLPDL